MKGNTTGFVSTERPKTIVLPKIKQESNKQTIHDNRSPLFKSLKQENLLSPNSNNVIKNSLLVHSESNKRVKFSNNVNNNGETTSQLTNDKTDSLLDNDQHIHQSNLTRIYEIQSENNNQNELLNNDGTHSVSMSKPKFYRSNSNNTLSISTVTSPSIASSRISSFLPATSSIYHHNTSMDNSSSIMSSLTIKYHVLNLSLLEFNISLSEFDKKKFNDIREQIPEEFEQLLPTLFKLGIVLWPEKLFDKKEQLTLRELRLRENLISIIEKDQQNSKRQDYLENLYGNFLSHDNILQKHHLLRENLSFQGQLSLLETYRDEIENLLTKKIHYWISIPMKSNRINFNDEINSISHSSYISTIFRTKNKFLQPIALRKTNRYSNIELSTYDELFSLTLPDQIDNQWSRKLLAKIIEQGMNILDQVRKLPQPSLLNQYDHCNLKEQEIVRKFKQWLFQCSTLYTEEN
ncbi:unnamed protein product [Rotaria sordida]|uniref:Uncharacterized protein n=1 Tax=Rotaria sordida TaxID=392033 RepID=A0A815JCF2_9BILA|nr:unnamed protein product [Rotaria sordida]